jgi:DNA polymerase I
MIEFNPGSNDHLSLLAFGGSLSIEEMQPVLDDAGNFVFVKSGKTKGQVKMRKQKRIINIKGFAANPKKYSKPQKKEGFFKVDEGVLSTLAQDLKGPNKEILNCILKIKELNKQISTYYKATRELLNTETGCIHASYNHTATETGRLSSSRPNMQNQPKSNISPVRKHFISRNGTIVSFDFKQLEVFGFAFLTQDEVLIGDLLNNVDIYIRTAAEVYNRPESGITKDERQLFKMAVLSIIYGSGPNRLADGLNISVDLAKDIIATFFRRYKKSKQWQAQLVENVKSSAILTKEVTKKGYPVYESTIINPTGRRIKFKTKDTPNWLSEKGIHVGFNPPDIKDWPVQSLATGDIVLIFLGKLFRRLLVVKDNVLLINTVHDSIDLDCKEEFVEQCITIVKDEVKNIPLWMKEEFGLDFNVPIDVSVALGKDWYEVGLK